MQTLTRRQRALLCFWLSVLFVVLDFCYGTVEVVGLGECADCKQNNIKTSQAFSGLRVTIDCKAASGDFERRGVGELDVNGNFKVSLPSDIVKSGEVKEECYAQLLSASAAPCPAHDVPFISTKIVMKSNVDDGKHTLAPAGKLMFSSLTCPSAFFWKHPIFHSTPHPPIPIPPIPKIFHKHPFFPPSYSPPPVPEVKPPPCPPKVVPPLPPKVVPPLPPKVKPPLPPKPPKVKPPLPPKPPKVKPAPLPPKEPPVPPKPPKEPPLPPKKPCPLKSNHPPLPPIPIIHKKPLPPFKPLPPLPPFKPFPPLLPFKPCPPLPKPPLKHFFHLPKLPPLPPKSVFHRPKYGKWPPIPPFSSHP